VSDDLLPFLRSVELFRGLPAESLASIARAVSPLTLDAGETLFRQGDAGDTLFLVVEGQLAVQADGGPGGSRRVGTVGPGECVGEGALLLSSSRAASVHAETPARLLGLSREAFERSAAAHPDLRSLLTAVLARRMPALRAAQDEIFGALDDEVRPDVERELSWVCLARDEVLFREGDPGDALYVVLQGRLQVVRERPGLPPRVLREIGRGEPVGEIALLTGAARSSTIRAARDSELLRFSERGFHALLERRPQALRPLLRTLAARLENATSDQPRAAPRATVVAVVALAGAPVDDVVGGLLSEQGEHGRVRAIDSAAFDAEHGAGAAQTPPEHVRALYLNEWMHRLEAAHDALVLVADAQPSAWSRRCLRQADRILLVARAAEPAGLGPFAPLVGPGRTTAARDLVLLHPDPARRPSGTGAWLDVTEVERHHHLRLGEAEDARRISRFLGGRAVGLVLSGGGARGFAHAGLVRALAEAGVPVDFVGGVSMGSLVAACHASGFDAPRTERALRASFVETRPHRGYTLPLVSVFSPRKTERALAATFGETAIEDLWVNYFCVASNITRATLHVFRRGPLWRAMRASGSFPGLLPPVPFHGELLVDGGVLDNLPVEVMQGLCPGPVLVSDTSQDVDLQVDPGLAWSPTAAEALVQRLRRGRPLVPGAATVLFRAIECRQLAHRRRQRTRAAFLFDLPVADYGLIDFPKIDAIIDAGYRYAASAMASLPAAIPRRGR
jgi:NTE family protein/lysophospholipid hydrolase